MYYLVIYECYFSEPYYVQSDDSSVTRYIRTYVLLQAFIQDLVNLTLIGFALWLRSVPRLTYFRLATKVFAKTGFD